MTWLAVPLYAHAEGLSNAEIGALFAAPVLAQVPLNLAGGAYTDRIGGRRLMLGLCWAVVLARIWLMFAPGVWMLMLCQLALGLSRAPVLPAARAMAGELPGARGIQLGRLNAATNIGQIAGTALGGFLLAAAGFQPTFLGLAGTGLMAFLAGLGTTPATRTPAVGHNLLFGYWRLLHQRIIQYSMLCAYLSALPFSLSISFYPLLLADFGYGEGASGILLALRALGAIAAGLVAARFVRTGPETLWPVLCGVAVAAAVGLVPTVEHAVPIGFWMLLVGFGSGAMTLYFQITIAEASRQQERGSALALGGLGWGISHLTTPLVMGFLADRYGIMAGFYAIGAFALACTLVIGVEI